MSPSQPSLEQVLADARGEAAVLRRNGHPVQAQGLERLCEAVSLAAHDYLTWVSEADVMRRTGRSHVWLRSRFPEWERAGHARHRGRAVREYRMLVLPQRANESAAYEEGRRAGRNAA